MKTKVLKPFDIDKAKAGAEVAYVNGNPVRIICYDAKGDWPIIALYTCEGGMEIVEKYNSETASDRLRIVEEVETPDRWRDQEKAKINGYFVSVHSAVLDCACLNTSDNFNVFEKEKQAQASIAAARISQIIANDPRFGGAIKDEEWVSTSSKYVIDRFENRIIIEIRSRYYKFIAFHTREQAELFLKENRDLVEQFYML